MYVDRPGDRRYVCPIVGRVQLRKPVFIGAFSRAPRIDYETFRVPSLMSKRTIRIPGKGGWRRRRDLRLRHCSSVEQLSRSLSPTDLAKMPNSRLESFSIRNVKCQHLCCCQNNVQVQHTCRCIHYLRSAAGICHGQGLAGCNCSCLLTRSRD